MAGNAPSRVDAHLYHGPEPAGRGERPGLVRPSRPPIHRRIEFHLYQCIYCYRHGATRKICRFFRFNTAIRGHLFCGRSFRLFIIGTARIPQPWEGRMMTTDKPVQLDEHRGMAAQKSTESAGARLPGSAPSIAMPRRRGRARQCASARAVLNANACSRPDIERSSLRCSPPPPARSLPRPPTAPAALLAAISISAARPASRRRTGRFS